MTSANGGGVIQKLTMAYHPQTNLMEQVKWNFKPMIVAYVKDNHWQWTSFHFHSRISLHPEFSLAWKQGKWRLGENSKGPWSRCWLKLFSQTIWHRVYSTTTPNSYSWSKILWPGHKSTKEVTITTLFSWVWPSTDHSLGQKTHSWSS